MRISDKIVGHNGSDFGVFSGMYFSPERNTGKIMIANTDTEFYDEELIWGEITTVWKWLIDYEQKYSEKRGRK